jgi:hypothetical protein
MHPFFENPLFLSYEKESRRRTFGFVSTYGRCMIVKDDARMKIFASKFFAFSIGGFKGRTFVRLVIDALNARRFV